MLHSKKYYKKINKIVTEKLNQQKLLKYVRKSLVIKLRNCWQYNNKSNYMYILTFNLNFQRKYFYTL